MLNFWEFEIWNSLIQFGFICGLIVVANILRRKIPFLRKSLLPTALIGGFIGLIIKISGGLDWMNMTMLDGITYHTIALGFIAMALKQKYGKRGKLLRRETMKDGINSGATIVGVYLLQGIVGLFLTLILGLLFFDWLFPGGGILLALAYGQGPGQSNNFGRIYEDLGFEGGQSFALSLVAIGFLVASVVSVIFINIMRMKGKISVEEIEKSSKITETDPEDEMPLSEPVDRMTMNIGVIMLIFLATAGFLFGIDALLVQSGMLGDFGYNTLRPMLFGFNFMFAMIFALVYKKIFVSLKSRGYIKHEYTNNQTLNRIAGAMFDFMIIAGVLLIDINVLSMLVIPMLILAVVGAVVTFVYLYFVTRHTAKGYETVQFVGWFAHLTGTISTGIAMIRVLDPNFRTKASDNLVLGSAFAIALGFPLMMLLGLAPWMPWLTLGLLVLLFGAINVLLFRSLIFRRRGKPGAGESVEAVVTNDAELVPVVQSE